MFKVWCVAAGLDLWQRHANIANTTASTTTTPIHSRAGVDSPAGSLALPAASAQDGPVVAAGVAMRLAVAVYYPVGVGDGVGQVVSDTLDEVVLAGDGDGLDAGAATVTVPAAELVALSPTLAELP